MIEVHGADAVARRSAAYMRLGLQGAPALINGVPGVIYSRDGELFSVLGFAFAAGTIAEVDVLADPARLRQLDLGLPGWPDDPADGSA